MVLESQNRTVLVEKFQYSLCRVVLMVSWSTASCWIILSVSVLALSSRFDGRTFSNTVFANVSRFSTRSVESF